MSVSEYKRSGKIWEMKPVYKKNFSSVEIFLFPGKEYTANIIVGAFVKTDICLKLFVLLLCDSVFVGFTPY